jgi:hypothetical protein
MLVVELRQLQRLLVVGLWERMGGGQALLISTTTPQRGLKALILEAEF